MTNLDQKNASKIVRKKRLAIVAFVLNGMLFLLVAWGFINEQKLIFAAIQLLASILNFGMIWNLRKGINNTWLELAIFL